MSNPRGRPFEPGNKFGRGRPKGSRNQSKPPEQEVLEEYTPSLMRKCIGQALQGDMRAMRLCLEHGWRTLGQKRPRIRLREIRTTQDVAKAGEEVMQAISRGKIAPEDGGKMISILEGQARIIEKAEIEARLETLEKSVEDRGLRPGA
jgi:hypothetical protein